MNKSNPLVRLVLLSVFLIHGHVYGQEKKSGNPADHLPDSIKRITWFGERPDWSHNGKRIIFVAKTFGDVFEYNVENGRITPLTYHYKHYGYTRALYLSNGDILLSGPVRQFDMADPEERRKARHSCYFSVLDKSLTKPPIPLGVMCSEGPAVSRTRLKIAWAVTWRNIPDGEELNEGESLIYTGDIQYDGNVPKLVNRTLVFDSRSLPFKMHSLETQNFVPPDDDALTISIYRINKGVNTDTYVLDLGSVEFTNITDSPQWYDEPEGIFPDGKFTTTESGPCNGKAWPLIDIYKVPLDGSGNKQRLTYFTEYKGYKASQSIISDDGNWLCFQIGKAADEAGAGYGLFLMKLRK